jgi:hypothetical protein
MNDGIKLYEGEKKKKKKKKKQKEEERKWERKR